MRTPFFFAMTVPLQEIINCLATHYPFTWAMPGDRVGLEVGHPEAPIHRVLVTLEATPGVVAEAQQRGAQLLLTHHPLLYHPLKEVREDQPGGRLLAALIRAGITAVCCHTNLDVAPRGLNDYLAELLELTDVKVLAPTATDPLYKLTVFVPGGYEDRVLQALAGAGLGIIGRYSHCSYAGRGQGTYRPLAGARPFRGEAAKLSRAVESRLEMLAPESRVQAALKGLKEVHPYEEPVYDLYPLKNSGSPLGLGRVGDWPEPQPFPQVISRVKEIFRVSRVRVWGRPREQLRRAAVLGGSGGDFILKAQEMGAEIYITGEVRHHQVPPEMADFAVLEVGHFASEVVFMAPWAQALQAFFHEAGLEVEVLTATETAGPCDYL